MHSFILKHPKMFNLLTTRSYYWKNVEKPTPMSDLVFKNTFGRESSKVLLQNLINGVVGPEDKIKNLTIIDPVNLPVEYLLKGSAVDVKAVGKDGRRYSVDVQVSKDSDYIMRAMFYLGKLYTDQLVPKKSYVTLKKSISIHFLNFNILDDQFRYHSHFSMCETPSGIFLPGRYFELHLIELPKYQLKTDQPITSTIEAWCAFFKDYKKISSGEVKIASEETNAKVKEAIDIMETFIDSRECRAQLELMEKSEWKQLGLLNNSEIEGKMYVAKNLFSMKFDIKVVKQATGLPEEILEKIQGDIK